MANQDILYSKNREIFDSVWRESTIMADRQYNFKRFDFKINGFIYEKPSDEFDEVVKPLEAWAALNGVFAPTITTVYGKS